MGRTRSELIAGLIVAVAALSPRAAADEPPPADAPADAGPSRAEALFQEGMRLMERGKFDEACDRLEKSEAIEPTVSTLGLLAGCHEQQGRLATAWREYRTTIQRAEAAGDARAAFAKARAEALERELPKLLIRVERGHPGLEIARNLERVPPEEIGADVAVDPGAYEIVARAPGKREHRVTVTIKKGERVVVQVPALVSAGAPEAAPAPAPPPRRAAAAAAPPPSGGLGPRQTAAWIAAGVGVAGLGVGLAFGASALGHDAESEAVRALCRTAEECARGREAREAAFQAATIGTIGAGFGAAGLLTALTLVLIPSSAPAAAPPARAGHAVRVAPLAGRGGGGALVTGRF